MKLTVKKFEELTASELYEILKARAKVFIIEQNINYQDMDNIDYISFHCFYMQNNEVTAYLRAFCQSNNQSVIHIGRVLTLNHGKGTGRKLMEESIKTIKNKTKCTKICLNAQKYAVGFYEKFGFKSVSDEFLEEGIIHIAMELEL